MKKFLSLVLALVMTMSLVTISAGAKEFADDDKVTYDEAVNVISTIGVVDGYPDGSFKPQDTLSRGAAAKIICNMILGPTTAAELHADTAPYKDVPVNHTFAGYIAYCAKEGIISGYADGSFRPAGTLTGYAFMKMLLGALGYDADIEGYTGANWSISVAKRALDIGLNKSLEGTFNGIKAVNREEAALYAFNTLRADLVEYETSLGVNANGNLTSLSQAKAQKWNNSATKIDNIKEDGYIQFAEQYFTKLIRDDDTDDFGRPSSVWSFNKKDIGTYVNSDLLSATFTKKVEGGDIYSEIGSNACDFDLTYWVDGVALNKTATAAEQAKLEKKNDKKMDSTGKGVLTEVFVDADKEETTIVVINTYLAEVAADYSEKNENVRLNVFTGFSKGTAPTTVSKTYTVSSDDVDGLEDLKEDDMVLVNIADDEVVIVKDVEVVEDAEITSYSTGYDDADSKNEYKLTKLTAGGEKYETAAKAYEDAEFLYDYNVEQLDDATYDLYLDPYGYIIGARQVDADDNYMFVAGYERSSTFLAKAIDKALVIFTDGTMETVDIKSGDLSGGRLNSSENVNTWYTYTEKNGVYNLEEVVARQIKDSTTTKLDKENVSVVDTTDSTVAHGNNDSVFIAVKADDDVIAAGSIVKVEDVATGIKHSALEVKYDSSLSNFDGSGSDNMIFAIYNKNGYITYAVVVGKSAGASEKLVYLTSGIKSKSLVDGDYIYTYEAITKDGAVEVQSFEAKDTANANLAMGGLYEASFDKDGVITEMEAKTATAPLQTATYKSEGYALTTIGNKSAQTGAQELYAKGDTLYFDRTDNQKYILLDENCNVFVRASDEDEDDYQEFGNIKSALSAIGEDSFFIGTIAAIVDDAGIATTLILNDFYEANDDQPTATTPVAPTISGDGVTEGAVINITGSGMGTIAITDRKADTKEVDQTADQIAREALEAAGFEVNSVSGTTYFVTAPNGQPYTFTSTVTVAEEVKVEYANTAATVKPGKIYVTAADLTVKIQVTHGTADWNGTETVTASSGATFTATDRTGKVLTGNLVMSAATAGQTITLTWSAS